MRLPRDVSGSELVSFLRRYGYERIHQTGDHVRLESSVKGHSHRITIPLHRNLRVGTLGGIVTEIANYLEIDRDAFSEALFA